jgi:hypothetical protein
MDISPRYIPGAADHLPGMPITFDEYHMVQEINWAVDLVRRSESTRPATFRRGRYLWLTNPEHLSTRQRVDLAQVAVRYRRNPTGVSHQARLPGSLLSGGPRTPKALLAPLVRLGDPLTPRADHGLRAQRPLALARRPALVHEQREQRDP